MSLRTRPGTPPRTATLPADFSVGSLENDSIKPEHWVSRLFPPTYRADFQPEQMKTILGDRLTSIDPGALREVFHRVHALLSQQRDVVEGAAGQAERRSEPLPEPPPTQKSEPSTDDSCIWDESEISVLRNNFKTTRDENKKLKTHMKFAEQRLASLDNKYTKLRRENEETLKSLNETKQANARFQIMCETLKKDIKEVKEENSSLQEELQSMKLERLDYIDKLKNTRIESDHDRIEKKRLELQMRENGKLMIETAAHLESKLRVKYQTEVNDLNMQIRDLQEELSEEKRIHAATRKGLDHLRTHFASLPIDKTTENDALTKISYH